METSLVKAEEKAQELQAVVKQAASIEIRNQAEYDSAMDFLKAVKQAQAQLNALCDPVVKAAHEAHKAATAQRAALVKPFQDAERRVKAKALDYEEEQERIARAEAKRLQDIADEQARKERERLAKAAEKLKTPELREERLAEAAAIEAPVVMAAPAVQRYAGSSRRIVWEAKVTAFRALVKSAASGNDLALSFLEFNQSAANKFAAANKGAIKVDGVEFASKNVMGMRV